MSRIGAPASGFYDPTLLSKFQALARYLPDSIKEIKTIRVYANKDTAALSRHVQAWRAPTNPICQGRLNSVEFADKDKVFYIGVNHAEKIIEEIKEMIFSDKQFAVLVPTGLISEIARVEDVNGISTYDQTIEEMIFGLNKIVLSQTNDTWLLKLRDESKVTEVLVTESIGCDFEEIATIMSESIEALTLESEYLPDWDDHNKEVETYITTRQMQREIGNKSSSEESSVKKRNKVVTATSKMKVRKEKVSKAPLTDIERTPGLGNKSSYQNIVVAPITTWIGKQLIYQEISKSLKSQIITSHEKYPDGLMAIPSAKEGGAPRIIAPVDVQRDLILQAHLDIHHQNHSKVYKLLSPLYYWPSMTKGIEDTYKACELCLRGKCEGKSFSHCLT